MHLNVPEAAHRSHAVTTLGIGGQNGQRLREWCENEAGVTLGIGLGMAPPDSDARHGWFRFGHMGHVNAHMIMGLLGCVEAGLGALNIPHTAGGVQAAAASISASVSPAT